MTVLRRFRLPLVGATFLLGCASTPAPGGPPPPRPSVLWGAYAAGAQYGRPDAPWDMGSLTAFERSAGKTASLVEWGQDWRECSSSCGMRPFRADLMQRVVDHGAVPVLSWGSYAEGAGASQPA